MAVAQVVLILKYFTFFICGFFFLNILNMNPITTWSLLWSLSHLPVSLAKKSSKGVFSDFAGQGMITALRAEMNLQIVAPSSSRGVPGEPQSFRSSQVSPTHVHNAPSCKHAFAALTGWMQSVEEMCLWLITSFPFSFCRYSCVRALLVPYRNTGRNMTKPPGDLCPPPATPPGAQCPVWGLSLALPHIHLHITAFTLPSPLPPKAHWQSCLQPSPGLSSPVCVIT